MNEQEKIQLFKDYRNAVMAAMKAESRPPYKAQSHWKREQGKRNQLLALILGRKATDTETAIVLEY